MHKIMALNHRVNSDCPVEIRTKLISVVEHIEKHGFVSDLTLCKIFGEMIWNDGIDYHSHALSFRIDSTTGNCQISQLKCH